MLYEFSHKKGEKITKRKKKNKKEKKKNGFMCGSFEGASFTFIIHTMFKSLLCTLVHLAIFFIF